MFRSNSSQIQNYTQVGKTILNAKLVCMDQS